MGVAADWGWCHSPVTIGLGLGFCLAMAILVGTFRGRAWRKMLKVSEMEFFLIIACFAFVQPFIRPLAQHICR